MVRPLTKRDFFVPLRILFPVCYVCTPYSVGPALKLLISLNPPFFFFFCYTDINSPKMKIFSLLILLSLSTIAIVSPLLAADSTSLSDLTNFLQLDPVSNVETDYNSPGMVEQTQPFIPGISTSQGTAGLPIKDSSLDAAQLQPLSPSNFDAAGSSFELAGKSPPGKSEPEPPATMETVYLCCESTEEDKYICDDRER